MALNVRKADKAVNRKGKSPAGKSARPKKHPARPNLRAWRAHFGFTLEQVAERLGVSHSTVVRWETGENGVSDEVFAAIAAAYGITVAELSAPPADAGRARELHRLMEAMRRLDDANLATLAGLAEQLAKPE